MRRKEEVFRLLTVTGLKAEIAAIEKGCGNKVTHGHGHGYCSYISTHGNLRLCKKCMEHRKIAKKVLEEKNGNRN